MAELPPGLQQLLNSLPDYETTVRCRIGWHRPLPHHCACPPTSPPFLIAQIPDEVTQHALRKSGYDCKDVRT